MRLVLVLFGLLVCASSASAQTDWHFYGGGVVGGEEHTRGFFGGSAAVTGSPVYVGVDGHGLRFTDEGEQLLLRAGGLDTIEYSIAGLDGSFGYVVRNATNRIHFIPVGIIGYTTGEIEACGTYYWLGRVCDDEKLTDLNVGGGFVAAFKGESGNGLHVGFRYTRNYGAAVSVGYIFQVD